MKRKNNLKILIISFVLISITAFAAFFIFKNIDKFNKTTSSNNIQQQIENNNINEINNQIINQVEYVDENPIKIGLYVKDGNYKKLVKDEYYCGWAPEEVLGIFYAVYTNEEIISGSSFIQFGKIT